MRFTSLVLLAFAGIAAAQTPIPPTETAPTGSVTVSSSGTRTGTRTGTNSATGTASGTITASTNATETLATSSAAPTTTSYPSLGDASTCVVNCLQSSISQANCSTIVDVNCYCTNDRFRSSLVQCAASNCPNDLSSAENLGQASPQFCNIVSVSLTYPPAPTSTTPASTSNPSNTATSAPNTNNAVGTRQGGMWALAALALGAAL